MEARQIISRFEINCINSYNVLCRIVIDLREKAFHSSKLYLIIKKRKILKQNNEKRMQSKK
jgi:hypothetical protein